MQWKFESYGVSHSQIYWFESCFCRPGVNFTLLLSPFLPDSDAQYLEPPIPLPLPLQLSLHYNDSFSILLLLFLLSDTHSAANFCESLLSPAPLCVAPPPLEIIMVAAQCLGVKLWSLGRAALIIYPFSCVHRAVGSRFAICEIWTIFCSI